MAQGDKFAVSTEAGVDVFRVDADGDTSLAAGKALSADVISESTAAAGVNVDGCLIKDGYAAGIATASMFFSNEVTGTGSNQNTAHSLGATPRKVAAFFSELPAGLAGGADIAHGTHDATNCVFNVTSGLKYYIIAFK